MTERTYGLYSKTPEDKTRCIEAIHGGEMWPSWHQCHRKRGFGPKGEYCKLHDPAAKAKRAEAKDKRYQQRMDAVDWPYKRIGELEAALKDISSLVDAERMRMIAKKALGEQNDS